MLVLSRHDARAIRCLLVALSLAGACESDSDTPPRDAEIVGPDAGHDSGLGGTQHPDGGHASDASLDASMGQDMPPFRMRLDGRMLVLDTLGHEKWSFDDNNCQSAFALEKFVNNSWGSLRDERPHGRDQGYYLDGKFVPGESAGCTASCMLLGKTRNIARAEEYVQTGTKRPPPDQPDPTKPVFVVETRPLIGPIRLLVHYHLDESCNGDAQVASIQMAIPSEGVCCPIGPEQCTSPGPGGGWAKSYEQCPAFDSAFAAFVIKADSHGCPVLKQDPTMCCDGDCVSMDAAVADTD